MMQPIDVLPPSAINPVRTAVTWEYLAQLWFVSVFMVKSIVAGAIAGLGGGAVFGMMMAMMGMLPMVAILAGSEDPMIGFIVHMAISAAIGGVYGLVAGRLPQTMGTAVANPYPAHRKFSGTLG